MIDESKRSRLAAQLRAVEKWSIKRRDAQPNVRRRDIYDRLIRYARHYRKQIATARTARKLDTLEARVGKIQLLAALAYRRDLPRGGR